MLITLQQEGQSILRQQDRVDPIYQREIANAILNEDENGEHLFSLPPASAYVKVSRAPTKQALLIGLTYYRSREGHRNWGLVDSGRVTRLASQVQYKGRE